MVCPDLPLEATPPHFPAVPGREPTPRGLPEIKFNIAQELAVAAWQCPECAVLLESRFGHLTELYASQALDLVLPTGGAGEALSEYPRVSRVRTTEPPEPRRAMRSHR